MKESSGECLELALTVITKASLSFFQDGRNSQKAVDVSVMSNPFSQIFMITASAS